MHGPLHLWWGPPPHTPVGSRGGWGYWGVQRPPAPPTHIFTSQDFSWLQKGQVNWVSRVPVIFFLGGGFRLDLRRPMPCLDRPGLWGWQREGGSEGRSGQLQEANPAGETKGWAGVAQVPVAQENSWAKQ